MQMSYSYASDLPFKTFCKLAKQAETIKNRFWLWLSIVWETRKLTLYQPRWCWTRLAKRAGRNFRSSSFSSDRRGTNISASWRWCGNSIGGSLAFDVERILEWHILTKYFAGRRKAVDVFYQKFYSIHKAAIFNAEQLILGITASRYVESLRLKGKFFPFLTSSKSILSHFLP